MLSDSIVSKIFNNFEFVGWPKSILITGPSSLDKDKLIFNTITDVLIKNIDTTRFNPENILIQIQQNDYPDLYIFPKDKIKIGTGDRNDIGTVRHLLNTFIPYAPKNSKRKFIYIPSAEAIGDEAESALLKVLEEPPSNTHFILSANSKDVLKDTIVSRCIEILYYSKIDSQKISSDPWERFWYFSGYYDSLEYKIMKDKNWLITLQDTYDNFNFTSQDYILLENLGTSEIKSKFSKESVDCQSTILFLSFLPLYFSIRDGLVEGMVPSMGPIRVPIINKEKWLKIEYRFQRFFENLRIRYFGVRTPNMNLIFYEFLSELMPLYFIKE